MGQSDAGAQLDILLRGGGQEGNIKKKYVHSSEFSHKISDG